MITEKDLQEAIAECEGQRNPNANTCIKLAAFYTIQEHLFGKREEPSPAYSFAPAPPSTVEDGYESDTEFGRLVGRLDNYDMMAILDELMTALSVVQPRLYAGTIRKMEEAAV